MHERVVGVGDSGLDQRPGGPDVKFLSNNKAFEWFAGIISVLKVSNYTLKKKKLKMKFKKQSCFSVTQSCPILCNPMDCSTPGFHVLHYLQEFAQTHVR